MNPSTNDDSGQEAPRSVFSPISRTQCDPFLPHEALSMHLAPEYYEHNVSSRSNRLNRFRTKVNYPDARHASLPTQQQQEQELHQLQLPQHKEQHEQQYLMDHLIGDVAIGLGVTAAIAPSLTAVDKALVQCAAGTHTFSASVVHSWKEMLAQPTQYLKSPTFLWMWATYAATYAAANCFDTLADENQKRQGRRQGQQPASSSSPPQQFTNRHNPSTASWSVSTSTFASLAFVGTTVANSTAALCKDRAYASMFGSGSIQYIPRATYAIWLARDFTVIGSSFLLPVHVAKLMESLSSFNDTNNTPSASTLAAAQFLTPMAAQLVAGPLHFMGLDVCNRPTGTNLAQRWTRLRGALSSVIPARMVRILPGYGVGGVWNQQGRQAWKRYLASGNTPLWRQSSSVFPPKPRRVLSRLQHHATTANPL